jgi:hypothetical protein
MDNGNYSCVCFTKPFSDNVVTQIVLERGSSWISFATDLASRARRSTLVAESHGDSGT